jgi:pimeloyl-ACP methyl ester carboxylesterase
VKRFTVAVFSFFAFAFIVAVKAQTPVFTRTDFHVSSTDGVQIFVRELKSDQPSSGQVALTWRDPRVAEAYREAALASDPAAGTHHPPALRAPTGAMEDSFYQAIGRQLYDASSITARVLIVRAENDFWSRPEDVQTLAQHLTHAHAVKVLEIPYATHYVHLDRPEHGRDTLVSAVQEFLKPTQP